MGNTKTILQRIPRRRCQEEVVFSDGSREVRCYSPANPHYYKDGAGNLLAIDMNVETSVTTGKGASKLRSSNVVSAGVRADGKLDKGVGLRPDFSQAAGTHQLEFTLVSVVVDGVDQQISGKVTAAAASAKDARAWDRGRYIVIPNRRFCRQAVLIDRPAKDFRIEFLIHAKGLAITPLVNAPGRSCWHVKDATGEVDWMITEPLILGANLAVIGSTDYCTHSMSDNGDGTFTYVKESVAGADFSALPDQFWVDASTVYSSTADGYLDCRTSSFSSCHNALTATTGDAAATTGIVRTASTPQICRMFLYFDLSGVSGTVGEVSLDLYGSSASGMGYMCQKGTQGSALALIDYDAFSGTAYGTKSSVAAAYNVINFNATGISDISAYFGGTDTTARIAVRELNSDYVYDGTCVNASATFVMADATGTAQDPYLSISFPILVGTSLDSLIKKSGVSRTAGVNALLQTLGVTGNAGLDGLLHTPNIEATTGLEAIIGTMVKSQAYLDGLVQRLGKLRQTGLHAIVPNTTSALTGFDVILRGQVRMTSGLDAALLVDAVRTTGLGAKISATRVNSALMDACKKITRRPAIGTDGLILAGQVATLGMDAIAVVVGDVQTGLDAVTKFETNVNSGVDAVVLAHLTQATGTDAALMSPGDVDVSVDAIVFASRTATAGLDVMVITPGEAGLGVDALISVLDVTAATGLDAAIQGSMAASSGLDGLAMVTAEAAAGMDVIAQGENISTSGLDAAVLTPFQDISASLDALHMVRPTIATGADAAVQYNGAIRGVLDGSLMVGNTRSAQIDGLAMSPRDVSANMDAALETDVAGAADMDACLADGFTTAALMDAALNFVFDRWLATDAILLATGRMTAGVDGVIAGMRIPAGASAKEIIYANPRVRQVAALDRVKTVSAPLRAKTVTYL